MKEVKLVLGEEMEEKHETIPIHEKQRNDSKIEVMEMLHFYHQFSDKTL